MIVGQYPYPVVCRRQVSSYVETLSREVQAGALSAAEALAMISRSELREALWQISPTEQVSVTEFERATFRSAIRGLLWAGEQQRAPFQAAISALASCGPARSRG